MNVVWFPIFSIADLWKFLKTHSSLYEVMSYIRSLNLHEKDSWRMWSLPSTRTTIPFHTLDERVGLQVLKTTCWMVFLQTIVFCFGSADDRNLVNGEKPTFKSYHAEEETIHDFVWFLSANTTTCCYFLAKSWTWVSCVHSVRLQTEYVTFLDIYRLQSSKILLLHLLTFVFLGPIWCFPKTVFEKVWRRFWLPVLPSRNWT